MYFYLLASKASTSISNIILPDSVKIDSFSFFESIISLIFAAIFGWLISNSYKYSSSSIYGGDVFFTFEGAGTMDWVFNIGTYVTSAP